MEDFEANRFRFNLDEAKDIAKLRSPSRIDGLRGRIMWMTAVAFESDATAQYPDDAKGLRKHAASKIPFVDETKNRNIEEDDYAALVL